MTSTKLSTLALICALIGGATMSPAHAKLTAQVKRTPAGPVLLVNGKPTAPAVFFVNFDASESLRSVQLRQVELAGKSGVDIVSFPIGVPWPEEGEQPDFREIDRRMDASLAANPRMMALLRIGVTWPGEKWQARHPSELMVYSDGKGGLPSIHSELWRRQAQDFLRAIIAHMESKYPDHVIGYHPTGQNTGEWFYEGLWDRRTPGFEPPARQAFRRYLAAKYGTDAALRAAWRDPDATLSTADVPPEHDCLTSTRGCAFRDPGAERRVIDFFEFQNNAMADIAALMCKTSKEAAPGKLTVAFYGYHFELSGAIQGMQSGGHLAMGRLLESPYVDVVCAPVSYMDRLAGGGGYFMTPVDSVSLHGKLWLTEDDTRTYLAKTEDRVRDARETVGVLSRNFAHILTRGDAVWWMDLFGEGWFNDEEIWRRLGRFDDVYRSSMASLTPYRPQIAVIVDDRSCLYLHPSPQVPGVLLSEFRKQWYRIGAPVGIYLLDDLTAGKVPPARMYVFIDTFCIDDAQLKAVRAQTQRKGVTTVWMYAPGIEGDGRLDFARVAKVTGIGLKETKTGGGEITVEGLEGTFSAIHGHLTPAFAVDDPRARTLARYADGGEPAIASKTAGGTTSVYCGTLMAPSGLLRQLAKQAGVHVYADSDDVVMAGNGFVAISATTAGLKTIRLPSKCRATDCVTGEALGTASEFTFYLQQGDTRILSVGE